MITLLARWLIGGLVFRSLVAYWLYPGFDEAYYYLYSLHLDWSYFDHPVLVALTTGFGVWLTGIVSQFTLRIGPLLLYTASLALLYRTGARLFGQKAAQWTIAVASVIPIFNVGFGILTLPDNPLIFFWTASLYCAACEFFPLLPTATEKRPEYRPSYRLALLGILVGLAILGKYHGFLLGFGLLVFAATSTRHRRALTSPWTAMSFALLLLALFPLWYWNWQHDWVSFRFQLSSRFDPKTEIPIPPAPYNPLNAFVVFLSSMGYLFPTLGIPLCWVGYQALRQVIASRSASGEGEKRDKYLLILCVSLPIALGFIILGGKTQILAGWPMPGFWGLTLILGDRAVLWEQQARRKTQRWLWGTVCFLLPIILLLMLHLNLGTLQKPSQYALLGGFIAPEQDPSRELIDTEQLRRGFQSNPTLRQALEDASFVATNAYYLGGFLGMALIPLKPIPIVCFSEDMRGFAAWTQPEQFLGKDGLYVTLKRFQEMPELTQEFSGYFQHFEEIGTVPQRRGGAVTEVWSVYRAVQMVKAYPRSAIDTLAGELSIKN